MATTLQLNRGTAAEAAAYTGAQGELFIDTENNLAYLHDGTTVGGHAVGGESTNWDTDITMTGDFTATNILAGSSSVLTGSGISSQYFGYDISIFEDASPETSPMVYMCSNYDQGDRITFTVTNTNTLESHVIEGTLRFPPTYGGAGDYNHIYLNPDDTTLVDGVPFTSSALFGDSWVDGATKIDHSVDEFGVVKAGSFVGGNTANWDTAYSWGDHSIEGYLTEIPLEEEEDIIQPGLTNTLDNPNAYSTSASDAFARSVAISGNYAIVGAKDEDDAGGLYSGKAYIFNATTGALVHTLDNPNAYSTSASDTFGAAVAISDNYAIVGAYQEDDAGGGSSGKAYIYNVSTGALLHTLDNPNAYDTSLNDTFGASVAISDNYAIVGTRQEDDADGSNSGKAYIFDVTTGSLLYTLDNPSAYSTSANDYFGGSVAISGNYAIVGAFNESDAGGISSGKAYIFDVTTGGLLYTLDNPNAYSTSSGDYFGASVAISGNYAIAGAYQESDATGARSGKAYIFDVTTGTLLHTLDNPNAYGASDFDRFGYSVAISGNYAIVGTYAEDDAGGSDSGKAYIFDVTTGTLLHTLDNPNAYGTSADDRFGWSVSVSDNYAIVGAYQEDDAGGTTSGKAYIYQMQTSKSYSLAGSLTATSFTGDGSGLTGVSSYTIVDTQAVSISAGQRYFALIDDMMTGDWVYTLPDVSSTNDGESIDVIFSGGDGDTVIKIAEADGGASVLTLDVTVENHQIKLIKDAWRWRVLDLTAGSYLGNVGTSGG
jgi:hypothetical protein